MFTLSDLDSAFEDFELTVVVAKLFPLVAGLAVEV
jgi:hypothetical protein